MGKILSRGLLTLYVMILIWLVLFKTSFSISTLVAHHHQRSLNLVPFAAPSMIGGRINYSEMVFNCVLFIPFGLLLDVNFKKTGFFPKLVFMLIFSLSVEITQYIFAIGATDITDVITNTVGGFLGLILYSVSNRYIKTEKLDRFIISVGILLLLLFVSIYASHFVRRRWR
ncbi:MAG: VanZ family protein [Bacteroidetes bacterium]|nr:VanZ family protein [Bacteroidota bacterium]